MGGGGAASLRSEWTPGLGILSSRETFLDFSIGLICGRVQPLMRVTSMRSERGLALVLAWVTELAPHMHIARNKLFASLGLSFPQEWSSDHLYQGHLGEFARMQIPGKAAVGWGGEERTDPAEAICPLAHSSWLPCSCLARTASTPLCGEEGSARKGPRVTPPRLSSHQFAMESVMACLSWEGP